MSTVPPPMPGGGQGPVPPPWQPVQQQWQPAPAPMPTPEAMPSPPPLGDGNPDPAVLHVTEVTRTYPCHACGGTMVFDPTSGQLRCPSCGTRLAVQAPTGQIHKHDLAAATQALRAATLPATLEREVVCQACGGRTAFTGTLTATRCPYCATPIQRDDLKDVASRLPIDGVLPFRVDQKTARANIEKWINSRWFSPKEFKTYREIGSFESIYLAYFSYDTHATATYSGQRGENYQVRVRGSDGQDRWETRTRWYPVSGTVWQDFRDYAAWANNGLSEGRVKALEPWPMQEAVPYSPEYVAGHLGRTYDLDANETFGTRVRGDLENQVDYTIRRDIGGDQQQIHQRNIQFNAISFAHLLLPVWLLTVTYAGKPYQVLMNGVTGEVQGERPWSKVKIALFVTACVIALIVIITLASLFGGDS